MGHDFKTFFLKSIYQKQHEVQRLCSKVASKVARLSDDFRLRVRGKLH